MCQHWAVKVSGFYGRLFKQVTCDSFLLFGRQSRISGYAFRQQPNRKAVVRYRVMLD